MEQPSKAADRNKTQQARANERNHALGRTNLVKRFSSEGGLRRLLHEYAPDAVSDAHAALTDSLTIHLDALSQPTSDVDTDHDPLKTRGLRLFHLHLSGQSNRQAEGHARRW